MNGVHPRRLVHRGRVEAEGFWLAGRSARARALELWKPGARLLAAGDDLLLLLPAPVAVDCARAPGAPLVRVGPILAAAPLAGDELAALAAPAGSIVVVRAGRALLLHPGELSPVDPSRWIDLGDPVVVSVRPLGDGPSAPPPAVPPPAPPREVLAPALGPRPRDSWAVEAALRTPPAPVDGSRSTDPGSPGARAIPMMVAVVAVVPLCRALAGGLPAWAGLLAASLVLVSILAARWRPGGTRTFRSAVARTAIAWLEAVARATSAEPSAPSERLGATDRRRPPRALPALRRAAARILGALGLAGLVGAGKGRYLGDLFRRFAEGDFDEALRRAIPLSGGGPDAGPLLGPPRPRADLRIPLAPPGPAPVLGLGPTVTGALARVYRQAAARLERTGRIGEAAFVLAELLGDVAGAVELLETHGLLRPAAELAEARELAPGLVVRAWFVAGDRERAVLVARRTGAFADAVAGLSGRPELAVELRRLWAEELAAAGDPIAAVEVAWAEPSLHSVAIPWLDAALELGAAPAARALARLVSAAPERFDALRPAIEALLSAPDRAADRAAFAGVLESVPDSPAVEVVRRAAVRVLVRDAGNDGALEPKAIRRLAGRTGDAAFRADLPPLPCARARPRGRAVELVLEAADAGPRAPPDAVDLPGGRLLVGYGEAGAELLSPDGKLLHRFAAPAYGFAAAPHGGACLAFAPRGRWTRITRLDLASRRARFLGDLELVGPPPRGFDGGALHVALAPDELAAVDVTAPGFRVLWRVDRLGGPLVAIEPGQRSLAAATSVGVDRWELWRWDLPSRTLRTRRLLELPGPDLVAIGCEGTAAVLTHAGDPAHERLSVDGEGVWDPGPRQLAGARLDGGYVAARLEGGPGPELTLLERPRLSPRATLRAVGPMDLAVRVSGGRATIAATPGRVVVVDLATGRVERDLRV
jgi:hypothetical protein